MKKSRTKICFVINPSADKNRSARHIDWLRREAIQRWQQFEIVITRENQSVSDLARDKSEHFDHIVACGGDGTINQVVNGIAGTDTILGILPIGSGNDFVKSIRMDLPLPECMELLSRGHTSRLDLIHCEGDAELWCVNTLGIGLDGLANSYAGSYKHIKGPLRYALGVLQAAFHFKGATIEMKLDELRRRDKYLMVTACNGKWEGGQFHVAPAANLSDGLMDLLLIRSLPLPTLLSYLPRFILGPSKHMKGVEMLKGRKLELTSKTGLAVHCDGEQLSRSLKNLRLTVKREALEVITPLFY